MLSCPHAQEKLSKLHTLKQDFEDVFQRATKEGNSSPLWHEAKLLKRELEQQMQSLSQELNPFETFNLEEQYESQLNILKDSNLLETLGNGEQGIQGIPFFDTQGNPTEQRHYPIPSLDQIIDWMRDKEELLKQKHQQGFTKMLLVPFGLPLERLTTAYQEQLQEHFNNHQLFLPRNNPEDQDEQQTTVSELNPMYIFEQYPDADLSNTTKKQHKTEGIVYYPQQFTNDHKGHTKQELLTTPPPQFHTLSQGWKILFVEDLTHIPRETQGTTKEQRPQLEANKSPNEYLAHTQDTTTENPYQHEQGMTPEDWFILALTNLHTKNEVTDDYASNIGSTCFLTGSYLPSVACVPRAYWDRGDARAGLGGSDAGGRWRDGGSRAVVGV